MKIVILFSVTESYRVKLAVSLKSMLEAHKDCGREIDIIIQSTDLSEETKCKLTDMLSPYPRFSITFQDGTELVAKLKAKGFMEYLGNYSCYKFFDLNNVLKDYPDETTCIISDADTYYQGPVLGAVDSLAESGKTLAMVREPFRCFSLLARERFADWNSGFVAINLGLWRNNDIENLLFGTLKDVKAQEGGFVRITGDQALLTMLCYKHPDFILTLPPKYNFLPALHFYSYKAFCKIFKEVNVYERESYEAAQLNPAFVHLIRGNAFISPWFKHGSGPYRRLWLDCLRRTPFEGDWQDERLSFVVYVKYSLVCFAYRILPVGIYAFLYRKASHI